MFETTEPVIEPRTTVVNPSAIANSPMISSGALPKLALRKPPTPSPVWCAAWSVASPISHASGIRASADRTNSVVASASNANRATSVAGVSTSDAQRSRRATPLA